MPIDIDIDIGIGDGGGSVGDCEMAEADEDAIDHALPLPGSAMEPCMTNM
jgi:hypothetical protein